MDSAIEAGFPFHYRLQSSQTQPAALTIRLSAAR
jgi:hypothetical protein